MNPFSNPFSGWGNGQNAPSVFGALPYATPPPPNMVTFYLTSFNPDVSNCTVIGPSQTPSFYIVTDPQQPGYTILRDVQGKSIALIEWQAHPLVEIRGVMSKQYVRDWLKLSSDKRSRNMTISGKRYFWAPDDKYINLYSNNGTPKFLGRVSRGHGTITLDMTGEAVQMGLLETSVTATLLLQCGRNID
ncbi:hypothetical protein Moror_4485 [Moniliophthora roreri MCA 2997]|uniref:DUF6593 domain-containing protein n=1 Tax=Moniliophthora roreri (strain MCA 2997) TaxID=1381753 RepID=V2X000_MONRO|nr:hypothetical protein Moror_4485 [Moniliophthora roreri MCA 2997]KAI3613987.1 hypothetical protein WG66_010837 [Moniliophthora roreri]